MVVVKGKNIALKTTKGSGSSIDVNTIVVSDESSSLGEEKKGSISQNIY